MACATCSGSSGSAVNSSRSDEMGVSRCCRPSPAAAVRHPLHRCTHAPSGGGVRLVLTAQKLQPRVHVSPMIMMVAVAVPSLPPPLSCGRKGIPVSLWVRQAQMSTQAGRKAGPQAGTHAPALPNVGAARLLADGGQLQLPHRALEAQVVLPLRRHRLEPAWGVFFWGGGVCIASEMIGRCVGKSIQSGDQMQSEWVHAPLIVASALTRLGLHPPPPPHWRGARGQGRCSSVDCSRSSSANGGASRRRRLPRFLLLLEPPPQVLQPAAIATAAVAGGRRRRQRGQAPPGQAACDLPRHC